MINLAVLLDERKRLYKALQDSLAWEQYTGLTLPDKQQEELLQSCLRINKAIGEYTV